MPSILFPAIRRARQDVNEEARAKVRADCDRFAAEHTIEEIYRETAAALKLAAKHRVEGDLAKDPVSAKAHREAADLVAYYARCLRGKIEAWNDYWKRPSLRGASVGFMTYTDGENVPASRPSNPWGTNPANPSDERINPWLYQCLAAADAPISAGPGGAPSGGSVAFWTPTMLRATVTSLRESSAILAGAGAPDQAGVPLAARWRARQANRRWAACVARIVGLVGSLKTFLALLARVEDDDARGIGTEVTVNEEEAIASFIACGVEIGDMLRVGRLLAAAAPTGAVGGFVLSLIF